MPFFNHVVFNFKENGVIYRLTKKWIHEVKRDNGRSFECKQQKSEGITIKKAILLFVILAFGVQISIIVYLHELIFKKLDKSSQFTL